MWHFVAAFIFAFVVVGELRAEVSCGCMKLMRIANVLKFKYKGAFAVMTVLFLGFALSSVIAEDKSEATGVSGLLWWRRAYHRRWQRSVYFVGVLLRDEMATMWKR